MQEFVDITCISDTHTLHKHLTRSGLQLIEKYSMTRSSLARASALRNFKQFCEFGRDSMVDEVLGVPRVTNEFWTSRQRAAHPLHEVSYRACFKPQLPRFFIERFSSPQDLVYDPFMGRGTTLLEAAFLGRRVGGGDANPLSAALLLPRLNPPSVEEVKQRLETISWTSPDLSTDECPRQDLLAFYHPETLAQLISLRAHLHQQSRLDSVDGWIQMVALNRLAGHSPGFFSVYTLPPNQAVSPESQRKINTRLGQVPQAKNVADLILKKTKSLLKGVTADERELLQSASRSSRVFTQASQEPVALPTGIVNLVVTSPPFLDVVDYAQDNWLRCWFMGISSRALGLTVARHLDQWQDQMKQTLVQLHRIVSPGGYVAFEVGEVRGGQLALEEAVIPLALSTNFSPLAVLINQQHFTKTANCWGVANGRKGTNTNRVVLLQRP